MQYNRNNTSLWVPWFFDFQFHKKHFLKVHFLHNQNGVFLFNFLLLIWKLVVCWKGVQWKMVQISSKKDLPYLTRWSSDFHWKWLQYTSLHLNRRWRMYTVCCEGLHILIQGEGTCMRLTHLNHFFFCPFSLQLWPICIHSH